MTNLEARLRLAADAFVQGVADAIVNATVAEVVELRAPKAPKPEKKPKPLKKAVAKPKVIGRGVSLLSGRRSSEEE